MENNSDNKKDYLYKGHINKEYLDWFGITEDEARADFSARIQEACICVSNKEFNSYNRWRKKKGIISDNVEWSEWLEFKKFYAEEIAKENSKV